MGTFFDRFPRVLYSPDKRIINSEYIEATNLMFRFGFIKDVINNTAAYTLYTIKDGDTPENLAQKAYDDAEACWIIMMANNINDPTWDWPLDDRTFRKFIIKKYGSIATAKTTYHHYNKVIVREVPGSGIMTIDRFQVNLANVSTTYPDNVPYETYADLADTGEYTVYDIDDTSVNEKIYRESVSNWDYEHKVNEDKRNIKVIKTEFYPRIIDEFNKLVKYKPSFYRNVS